MMIKFFSLRTSFLSRVGKFNYSIEKPEIKQNKQPILNKEVIKLEDKLTSLLKKNSIESRDFIDSFYNYSKILKGKTYTNDQLLNSIHDYLRTKSSQIERYRYLFIFNTFANFNSCDMKFYQSTKKEFKAKFEDFLKDPSSFDNSQVTFSILNIFFQNLTHYRSNDKILFIAFLKYFLANLHYFNNDKLVSGLILNFVINLASVFDRSSSKLPSEVAQTFQEMIKLIPSCIDDIQNESIQHKIQVFKSVLFLKNSKFKSLIKPDYIVDKFMENFREIYIEKLEKKNGMKYEKLKSQFEEMLKENSINYIKDHKTEFSYVDFIIKNKLIFEVNEQRNYIGFSSDLVGEEYLKMQFLLQNGFLVKNISEKDLLAPEYINKLILNSFNYMNNKLTDTK